MSFALLFPGQGTQHDAMLPWLLRAAAAPPAATPGRPAFAPDPDDAARAPGAADASVAPAAPNAGRAAGSTAPDGRAAARAALDRLDAVLGAGWRDRLGDPHWSTRNAVAQPLLTGVCVAAWERLRPLLPAPAAVAGYSVGELAAFSAAGVFGPDAALALAQRRAAAMDGCTGARATGLLSIGGGPPGLAERLCARHALEIAIRIAPDRVIVGGADAALTAAARDADAAGANTARLAVSIASHTRWVAGAVAPFAAALADVAFARPRAVLVCNLGGVALRDPDALRDALAGQIAHTVAWDCCMDTLAERRVRCVLEVGPGTTLARLWQARHPSIAARSVDEFQRPEAAADWVRAQVAAGAG